MGGWFYLDYRVSSGPFLRFTMRFDFLSEMFDHSVCETRDLSLTIIYYPYKHPSQGQKLKTGQKKHFLGGHPVALFNMDLV